jgi:hypothetical protein
MQTDKRMGLNTTNRKSLKMTGNFADNGDFHSHLRDLLHAAYLRHGTDGFTSPLKEGVLRIFSP